MQPVAEEGRGIRRLYVIVEEPLVTDPEVMAEINRIIEGENHVLVNGNHKVLHPDMPKPSKDLEVVVIGACRDAFCEQQTEALKNQSYNARLY